jgi:hypothetical protein
MKFLAKTIKEACREIRERSCRYQGLSLGNYVSENSIEEVWKKDYAERDL